MAITSDITIRPMQKEDWRSVAKIYQQGIETGYATFEQTVPGWEEWNESHMKCCRLIAESNNNIVGWAALSAVSERCVYAGVAEVSIYVATDQRGKKIGSKLMEHLISASESENLWTLQAGIFSGNKSSIKLHENFGFRKVGFREKIGQLNGQWKDTILLERRSKIVGWNNH